LTDGDFEDNPTTAWTTFGNAFLDGEVIGDLDQAAGFSGAESAKTFGNFNGDPNFTGFFQDIAVDGVNLSVGDLIQMSGYIASPSGDAMAGGNLAFYEITFFSTALGEFGFGDNTSANFTSGDATDSWQFFTTEGVFIPAEAEAVRAKAVFVNIGFAGGSAWFDNAQLQKIPEPASLSILGACALGMVARRRRS
ncbi:MAG: PEP-CTERM sorting domain-containing protein, partial [Planctomycetota bacterium]